MYKHRVKVAQKMRRCDYLIVGDELLLDDLHGVDSLRLLQLDHQHLRVAATPDDPEVKRNEQRC